MTTNPEKAFAFYVHRSGHPALGHDVVIRYDEHALRRSAALSNGG